LVVARLASGVMSITTCYGSDSVDNPVFPRSGSRVISTAGLPSNSFVNPDTDVVLAAVYRSGGSVITNARIVDKRVTVNSGIILQGNATPASGLGTDGDLYLKTLVEDDDSSGVFVKRSGEWGELAAAGIDPGVPIGAVITWVSSIVDPNPDIWVECDGSALPRTGEYTELFATLGTTYGAGDGATTFNLPDFRGQFLMGMPAAGRVLGTRYGNANNQITLSTSNLPSHSHGVGGISTSQTGDHAHLPKSSTGGGSDPFNWGFIERSSLLADASVSINRNPPAATFGISRSTANAGQHAHTIAAGSVTGLTGSGSAVSIEPSNFSVRFFIRYA
jgi:microcystin-dependent protein